MIFLLTSDKKNISMARRRAQVIFEAQTFCFVLSLKRIVTRFKQFKKVVTQVLIFQHFWGFRK